jgi:hypothetical protein
LSGDDIAITKRNNQLKEQILPSLRGVVSLSNGELCQLINHRSSRRGRGSRGFDGLDVGEELEMHLQLCRSDRLNCEVIESRGVVVNKTKVPPSHIEIKFLKRGERRQRETEREERQRERQGERDRDRDRERDRGERQREEVCVHLHDASSPMRRDGAGGDIHRDERGGVWGMQTDPKEREGIRDMSSCLGDGRSGSSIDQVIGEGEGEGVTHL